MTSSKSWIWGLVAFPVSSGLYRKHQLDIPQNSTSSNHQKYILTPCLRDTTMSISFRKNFFTHRIVIKHNNKIWVERYLHLFLSVLKFPAAFYRQRSQQINGVRRITKGVRYAKPKINNHRPDNPWNEWNNNLQNLLMPP